MYNKLMTNPVMTGGNVFMIHIKIVNNVMAMYILIWYVMTPVSGTSKNNNAGTPIETSHLAIIIPFFSDMALPLSSLWNTTAHIVP